MLKPLSCLSVIALIALVSCKSPAEPGTTTVKAPQLKTLVVVYDGALETPLFTFKSATKAYVINADAGKSVKVTEVVAADADAVVAMTSARAGFALNTGAVATPAAGEAAKVIYIDVSLNGNTSRYSVVIAPPQNSDPADKTLMYMDAFFEDAEGPSDGQIIFNKATTNYTVNTPEGYDGAKVFLNYIYPSSSRAAIAVSYGIDDEHTSPLSVTTATNITAKKPAPTGDAMKFFVTVTSGNHTALNPDTQRYIVTINPYGASRSWNGTVTLENNAVEPKTTVSVTARGADIKDTYTAEVGLDNKWTVDAPVDFTPVSFIVTLTLTGQDAYRSKAYSSPDVTISEGQSIALSVNCGTGVGKAVFSPSDLQGFQSDVNANYSLADDITLPDDWAGGPEGYKGKFYGNGYTISNLKFTGNITNENLGLFKSLANNAELHDFTVVVVPSSPLPTIGSSVRFGGVIGNVTSGTALISGVTITGTLALGVKTTGYLYIGGIIGELSASAAVTLTIENCVSSLDILAESLGNNGFNGLSVGGLVGRQQSQTLIIRDSYSSGDIKIVYGGGDGIYVGGLVGYVASGPNLTVEHCYSTSTITSTYGGTATHNVGGLLGMMTWSSVTLTNSVALNPAITATGGTLSKNRAVGAYSAGTISNVYALSTDGDGAANNAQGLAKTETELRTAATWTTDLGFNTTRDVWDFSGLAAGWPKLK
jgi:hypothetical protein